MQDWNQYYEFTCWIQRKVFNGDDLLTVELPEDGRERPPIPVIRDSTPVVTLSRQIADCVVLDFLKRIIVPKIVTASFY